MFNKIDTKIKTIAKILFWVCITMGIVLFIYFIKQYSDYSNYISSSFSFSGLIYSVSFMFFGTIGAYVLYGFGEIISNISNIKEKLDKSKNL